MSLRLASVLFLVLAACSSDPSRPPPGTDPTTVQPGTGKPPGGGGTTTDGGTVITDAGTDGPAVCNDITLTGAIVDQTAVTGDPPAGAGGSIVDGTYDLTDSSSYVGNGAIGPTGTSIKETIRIAAGTLQQYRQTTTSSGTTSLRASYTMAVNNSTVSLAETCPTASLAQQWTFTVTGSQLALISPTSRVEFVYTKK
jgi:hypothetical protein